MTYHTEDTIVAIASAAGGAYRGIVRLSGQRAIDCVQAICRAETQLRSDGGKIPHAWPASLAASGFSQAIPALVYLWPTRSSFTREPTAELHTLGSPPILNALVTTCCEHGARLAEPGEFTLRAFLAGRIDLTQAEAVLGVIDAKGQHSLQSALAQLAGGLSTPLTHLRNHLLDLLAHLEAGLDFVEEDIEFISSEELTWQLAAAKEQITDLLHQMSSRSTSNDVPRVVLTGLPNAGKSSLFNALAGQGTAIVSSVRGTTRDFLTAKIQCGDVAIELVDTAGVEELGGVDSASGHTIEHHAQAAMESQRQEAALRILCVDASQSMSQKEWERIKDASATADVLVWTKCDQAEMSPDYPVPVELPIIYSSAHTGRGLADLQNAIVRGLEENDEGSLGSVAATANRCRDSLQQSVEQIERAIDAARANLGEELVAAEIRGALHELSRVVGAIYTDDILDRVFSRFCIGK